jgi:hypothetical protein
VYGSILAFLSFVAAGAGHGTYIPLFLSSAPFGLVGIMAAIAGAPVVWAGFGALVAPSGRAKWYGLIRALALAHYVSGLALVAAAEPGMTYLGRVLRISPESVAIWLVVYVVGQVALWWRAIR